MKKIISLLLTLSLFLSQFTPFLTPKIYASSGPWTQTDWSGGSGQTSWSDATKYDSSSSITTSTVGQVTLTNTEQFSNAGFETDLTGWTASANSLGTSLNAFWGLEESSGNRSDSAGSNTLTDNNTVTQTTGKIGNAAQFTAANSEYLSITDNASLSTGDIDFTISGWFYFDSNTNRPVLVSKDNNSVGVREYIIIYDSTASPDLLRFSVFNQGTATAASASNVSDLSTGTWYFFVAWHDSVNNTVNIQVNNGTVNTVSSASVVPIDTAATFRIGYPPFGSYFDGRIDTVGFWKKVLTSAEKTALYNNGNGGEYPFYTNTRDTSTTYNSSSGSSKIVTIDTTNFTQSINVGNTNSYSLSVYAYTDGSAVTSSDVELYANGSTVSTTYTSVGGGWYKLTGTATGVASSVGYGAQVKTNKTVYLDDFSLNNHASSGTLTSSIFDTEQSSNWGTLTYTAATPTNTSITVRARTSNSSTMAGATAFSSCDAITSGSDISSNNCVTDTYRYIQYQVSLANTDSISTPTFQDITTTFTGDAPSISLTALSPDPNSDTTPTLSGTVTEEAVTVSNVQFQMDSTSGSWTACTADDGSFDESTETFTCTASTLSDGSHTVYVKATDSNGNTTASDSYASDTFTIDSTAPISIELDSPGDNSYTNSERPTFKWKATSDATAGLSKYVLEIDNPSIGQDQPSGDFTIDNIPVNRTTDYETNRYTVHYENFSDSDSTNNYISIYTKSHNDWGSDANDGKLREGKVSWKVKAIDNAGNEASSSRTLFVDRSQPKVELTQINNIPFSSTSFLTTDKTPTIFGKITDSLSGGDPAQIQDENGPRVASGPKQVDIKVEKKVGLDYKLITLYTVNIDKPWYTCDNKEVSDNSKQKCDKYLPFKYVSKENLELGTYKITLAGKDKADNLSNETTFTLNITTFSRIITPEEEKIIEEEIKELPKDEQEKVKEELEITKPIEPSALENAQIQISQTSKNIIDTTGNFIGGVFTGIGNGVSFIIDTTGKALAFVGDNILRPAQDGAGQALAFFSRSTSNILTALYNGTTSILAYIGQGLGNGVSNVTQGTGNLLASIGEGIGNTGKAIGNGYNQLAKNAPGVTKTILTGIGDGVSATTSTIASTVKYTTSTTVELAQNTSNFIGTVADNVGKTTSAITQNTTRVIGNVTNAVATTTSMIAKNLGSAASTTVSAIANVTQNGVNSANRGIANFAFSVGGKTDDVSHSLGTTIIKIGYLFVPEPTKIANVKVARSTPTSMTITWETNHPANGKVNYGLTADYGQDAQSDKRITQHVFTVTGLEPNTTYYYEVMSQNRNYVYDATHTFTTPER